MEIFALNEGSYSVDSTKKFIPFDPAKDDAKTRPGSLFIHVNPFLIKTQNDLILLDAGLGFKDNDDELWLHKNIRNHGFEPDDVSVVLMSHLHFDHSAGLVAERNGRLEPSFPQAQHVIERNEWEFAFSGKSSSYHKEIFEVLQRSADVFFTEGNGEYKPGIRYEHSGGHCPHHQVFWLEAEGKKAFYGGDELPEPEQLLRRFIAKYDYDGRKAMELREIYGRKAAEEGWTCLFYHAKRNPIGNVKFENDAFSILPV
ncbi:MBL fold metallo-hydrolase [Mucilaginibacter sp. RS28]|uniref:MBL fold metallo-hydrolase n=1 Tax=Mucilaginibacter straminoryzae TaxID=2932774 RepID=A0A9X2BA16_9SPHI|nr:MBL fold metallo-hydrolase [Mucilaginibacter straminoryzae]MCJ8211289.1 MBL fold metallo-hydrolase [Mucilaginibacter straminoryzae]